VEYIQALLSYVRAASPHLTEEEVLDALRIVLDAPSIDQVAEQIDQLRG